MSYYLPCRDRRRRSSLCVGFFPAIWRIFNIYPLSYFVNNDIDCFLWLALFLLSPLYNKNNSLVLSQKLGKIRADSTVIISRKLLRWDYGTSDQTMKATASLANTDNRVNTVRLLNNWVTPQTYEFAKNHAVHYDTSYFVLRAVWRVSLLFKLNW